MPSVTHPLQAASLSGHDAFVEGVEFSSNGKYIMSSSSGELIQYYANLFFFLPLRKESLPRFISDQIEKSCSFEKHVICFEE